MTFQFTFIYFYLSAGNQAIFLFVSEISIPVPIIQSYPVLRLNPQQS